MSQSEQINSACGAPRRPQASLKVKSTSSAPMKSFAPTNQQHLSIISLSKLRNYMPQNQSNMSNARLLASAYACTPTDQLSHTSSILTPPTPLAASYRGTVSGFLSNQSSTSPSLCFRVGSRQKSARATSPTSFSSNPQTGVLVDLGEPVHLQIESSGNRRTPADQQTAVTQQEPQQYRTKQSLAELKHTKGAAHSRRESTVRIEERKRKKIETASNKQSDGSGAPEVGDYKYRDSSSSTNNMTPSTVLLQQNHNYIEQQQHPQQQQSNPSGSYNESNQSPQRQDVDLSFSRSKTTPDCERGASSVAKQTDDLHRANLNDLALSSSSSVTLAGSNVFNALDGASNSSINNGNNLDNNSSANHVNQTHYLTNQGLNQAHQLTESERVAVGDNHSHQDYTQDLASVGSKEGFMHYAPQDNRLSMSLNCQPTNFSGASTGTHIKHEDDSGCSNVFDRSNLMIAEHNNVQGTSTEVNQFPASRSLPHSQMRANVDQYYTNHYNPLPSSSKSSSPNSSASTPSPKSNAMHSNTSQHSNQHISSSITNVPTQFHFDHLNHHYMNNSFANSNANSQQAQVANHHYTYNHNSVVAPGQHHLSVNNHEQNYGHQQHQPPHHQQHNIPSQQSIYQHLANNAATASVSHMYGNSGNAVHYQSNLQGGNSSHTSHFMAEAHQNHINSATAAACAAAVVSQTMKTVANQHNHQSPYGQSISNGFNTDAGSLINMTAQHHQQFHNVASMNNHHHHHLVNPAIPQQQQQAHTQSHHSTSIITRKYQCKMCPQVFMSKAEMKYHNQNHMREAKPYKCLQCPKAFANSSYLSQHMRIHQGVKPYTCDICSRKFTQLSHLQQHKRTHTGDKPYKCNYMNCTKQFSQLSNLQSHSRCHQLDKPYKCNSCYKCFHDEQSLLEHIPRHLESKHLKKNLCIFCGSSYQQERGLVKHFQQYHTDKSPTLVAAAIAAGTTGNTNLIASLVSSTQSIMN